MRNNGGEDIVNTKQKIIKEITGHIWSSQFIVKFVDYIHMIADNRNGKNNTDDHFNTMKCNCVKEIYVQVLRIFASIEQKVICIT